MARNRWLWGVSISVLLVVGIIGAFFARSRYPKAVPVDISCAGPIIPRGTIYIGDGVALPGYYPFTSADTIGGLIQAAGGTDNQSDFTAIKLYIPLANDKSPQKIDINRAERRLTQ